MSHSVNLKSQNVTMFKFERLCHTQLTQEVKTLACSNLTIKSYSVKLLSQNVSTFKFERLCHTWLTQEVKTLACSNLSDYITLKLT